MLVIFYLLTNIPIVNKEPLRRILQIFFMQIENYSNHHEADTLTYFYHILLTRWGGFSLTECTEASPPAPLRMERGVVCEVTPIGLLKDGEETLNVWRTYRGISVITPPLHSERGWG